MLSVCTNVENYPQLLTSTIYTHINPIYTHISLFYQHFIFNNTIQHENVENSHNCSQVRSIPILPRSIPILASFINILFSQLKFENETIYLFEIRTRDLRGRDIETDRLNNKLKSRLYDKAAM